MDDIRIGIVGLGGICRARHVPGFRAIEGVRLCAVANRTYESSLRAAREAGIPEVCGSWQELVARDDINTVVVGAWPYLHCDVSVTALEAGKHVFCQARMARDREEAECMAAAARKSDRVTGLCPVPYGLSIDRLMARLLGDNVIGPVRYVVVSSFSDAWTDPETPVSWRKDRELSGLNVQTLGMFIEVIHRWFGWTTRVHADMFLYTLERPDGRGGRVPVRIPDQVIANTVVGGDLPVHYVISGVSGFTGDTIDIYGEKGSLHYDVGRDVLYQRADGAMNVLEPSEEERYDVAHWRVEQDFVDAIRQGTPYRPDFEEGSRYMAVIQAMHDAAATGKTVAVV